MKWINNVRNQLNETQTQNKTKQKTKVEVDRTTITGELILKDKNTEQEYILKNNDSEIYKKDILEVKKTNKNKKISGKTYKIVELKNIIKKENQKTDLLQDIINLLDINKENIVTSKSSGNPLSFKEEGLKQLYNRLTQLLNSVYLKEKAEVEQ